MENLTLFLSIAFDFIGKSLYIAVSKKQKKLKMSAYTKMIIKFTGCTEADAPNVEDLMRSQYPTLDHLSRALFRRTAKAAYDSLLWSRTPEGIAYQEQLKKEFYGI